MIKPRAGRGWESDKRQAHAQFSLWSLPSAQQQQRHPSVLPALFILFCKGPWGARRRDLRTGLGFGMKNLPDLLCQPWYNQTWTINVNWPMSSKKAPGLSDKVDYIELSCRDRIYPHFSAEPMGLPFACMCACSVVSDSVTPWTVAHQAPQSMRFPRQEHWSGLPCPPLGDLPDPEIKLVYPASPKLAAGFLATDPPEKPFLFAYMSIKIFGNKFKEKTFLPEECCIVYKVIYFQTRQYKQDGMYVNYFSVHFRGVLIQEVLKLTLPTRLIPVGNQHEETLIRNHLLQSWLLALKLSVSKSLLSQVVTWRLPERGWA